MRDAQKIESLRAEIDDVDRRLVALLRHRLLAAVAIAKAKKRLGRLVYDPERERDLVERVRPGDLRNLYAVVILFCRRAAQAAVRDPDDGRGEGPPA